MSSYVGALLCASGIAVLLWLAGCALLRLCCRHGLHLLRETAPTIMHFDQVVCRSCQVRIKMRPVEPDVTPWRTKTLQVAGMVTVGLVGLLVMRAMAEAPFHLFMAPGHPDWHIPQAHFPFRLPWERESSHGRSSSFGVDAVRVSANVPASIPSSVGSGRPIGVGRTGASGGTGTSRPDASTGASGPGGPGSASSGSAPPVTGSPP